MKILAIAAIALAGAAVAGFVAHASGSKTTVTVTEKEFHISLSAKKAPTGAVRFVVKNTGAYPHSLAITGPGLEKTKTPTIRPGKSATLAVTLKTGKYTLWCPIPGHAAQGMKTSITAGSSKIVTPISDPVTTVGGGSTDTTGEPGAPWG